MAKKRITDELIAEMARLYVEERKGVPEIAETLGFGKTSVYRYLDRLGIDRRPITEVGVDGHLASIRIRQKLKEVFA